MKILKLAAIITGLIFIGFIIRGVYMVLCISCTFPPIKEYKYYGSMDQISYSIQKYIKTRPYINFKLSRRDSSAVDDNGPQDMEIVFTKDTVKVNYDFVCVREESENYISIKLIDAITNVKPYGGYSGTADGVGKLLKDMEQGFLIPLKREENLPLDIK